MKIIFETPSIGRIGQRRTRLYDYQPNLATSPFDVVMSGKHDPFRQKEGHQTKVFRCTVYAYMYKFNTRRNIIAAIIAIGAIVFVSAVGRRRYFYF